MNHPTESQMIFYILWNFNKPAGATAVQAALKCVKLVHHLSDDLMEHTDILNQLLLLSLEGTSQSNVNIKTTALDKAVD